MLVKLFLCIFLCCFLSKCHVFSKDSDYDSSEENIFEEFNYKLEPFKRVENMIDEARGIVLGILRGDLSDEIKEEIKKQDIDLSGSYDGVSKLVKKCLRKAKNKKQGKELVKKCFEKALNERQNEEINEEEQQQQPTIQSCIQEAMLDASQSAAPLMMEVQEHGALFREMMQQTASALANCRAEERPFQCMMGVWANTQQNMTFMRDQVIEMMLVARDIYIQYMDDVRKCITPVEEVDEEENQEGLEEGEEIEEEGIKKDPPKATPAYYDPVEETRKKAFSEFPPSV